MRGAFMNNSNYFDEAKTTKSESYCKGLIYTKNSKNKTQSNYELTQFQISYLMRMVHILDNACIIAVVLSVFSTVISFVGIILMSVLLSLK